MKYKDLREFFQILSIGLVYLVFGVVLGFSIVTIGQHFGQVWYEYIGRAVAVCGISVFLMVVGVAVQVLLENRAIRRRYSDRDEI